MRIGWVGLGKMGLPIAKRLSAAGHETKVYCRSEAAVCRAAQEGFSTFTSLTDMAAFADIVISAVSDDVGLRSLVADDGGLADAFQPGQTFIDISTVSPDASHAVADLLTLRRVAYLRAPVSGSTALAESGSLTAIISGPPEDYARLRDVFTVFASKQFYVGDGEQARSVKLAVNTMVAATSALFAEALALGCKHGVEIGCLLEVMAHSPINSPLLNYKRAMIQEDRYDEAAFTVKQMIKDLDIVLSMSHGSHVPMPLTAQIRKQYEAALVSGKGEQDFFVLIQEMARRAGL